jgi:hypothetical protein
MGVLNEKKCKKSGAKQPLEKVEPNLLFPLLKIHF